MNLRKVSSALLAFILSCSITWKAGSSFAAEQVYYLPPEKFTDVSEKSYWFESVQWLKEQNIVLGYMDGTFQGEKSIQRAEALKMILSLPVDWTLWEKTENDLVFSDVPADAWFSPWVEQALDYGLIQGYDDGSFKPEQSISRAEALTISLRVLQKLPEFEPEAWHSTLATILAEEHLLIPDETQNYRLDEAMTRYELADLLFRLLKDPRDSSFEFGVASYYGYSFDGARTASGKKLEAYGYMTAHKTLPFGTKIKVSSLDNEKFVIVEVVDRGPHIAGRIVDLTPKAFEELAPLSRGVFKVKIEVLDETSP